MRQTSTFWIQNDDDDDDDVVDDDNCMDYEPTTDVSAYIVFYNEIGPPHIEGASGCRYQSIAVNLVVPHPTHGM